MDLSTGKPAVPIAQSSPLLTWSVTGHIVADVWGVKLLTKSMNVLMGNSGPSERAGGHVPASGKHLGGSASDLLGMIRQQKLQRRRLCQDPIYLQYLCTEKQRAMRMRRKGWVEHGAARPQMDDDLDSEARQRVTALVTFAAKNRGGAQAGVWAAFGKPFKTLGKLEQVLDLLSSDEAL